MRSSSFVYQPFTSFVGIPSVRKTDATTVAIAPHDPSRRTNTSLTEMKRESRKFLVVLIICFRGLNSSLRTVRILSTSAVLLGLRLCFRIFCIKDEGHPYVYPRSSRY